MSGKAAASLLISSWCYIATRPEVEGFRDQDFVLQIYLPEVETRNQQNET